MKFHELRIDHKLVNAESQQNVDFRTRKANKRAKEDLRRVPECKSRPNSSGMKQWFQLRASRSDFVIFTLKGGGVFIGKVEPLGSFYRISCLDLVRTCVQGLDSVNLTLGPSFGWKGIALWSNERPDSALNAKSSVRHVHAARLMFWAILTRAAWPLWSAPLAEFTLLVPVACLSYFQPF